MTRPTAIIQLTVILLVLFLPGCFSQSRSETTRTDRITFQAQVPLPTPEGVKMLPVSGSIKRVGIEQEETHAGPDTEAITQAITSSLASIAPALGGAAFPWTGALGGAGAVLTAATTGYLAMKKREQMRLPVSKKEV
jgi:hypothetical protein